MARTLKTKAEDLFKKVKGFTNRCVSNTFDGLDYFGRIYEDQLAMMKEANELMKESQEFFVAQAAAMDEMSGQLEELQTDMVEINKKLTKLLKMQEKKGV